MTYFEAAKIIEGFLTLNYFPEKELGQAMEMGMDLLMKESDKYYNAIKVREEELTYVGSDSEEDDRFAGLYCD